MGENNDRIEGLVSPGVGGRSLERLSIKRSGVWPFGNRFDAVAQFDKGTSVTIDCYRFG
jgi:hypothetical protein